jgi:uncharacterized protein (TIGR02599 family)
MNPIASPLRQNDRHGFTIMELLLAMTILSVLLVVTVSVVGHTSTIWRRSSENIEAFQSARVAFDLLTRELSQATLNTYLDYDDNLTPTCYLRKSELQFVCGEAGVDPMPGTPNTGNAVFFQAPISYTTNITEFGGLDGALNACGFYVTFGPNSLLPAHATNIQHYRFRLMNLLVPVENNRIFDNTGAVSSNFDWFKTPITTGSSSFPVADNVIALIVHPEDPDDESLFTTLDYNSLSNWNANPQPITANQLPPLMQVALVAIDEASAKRLENGTTAPTALTDALSDFQAKLEANPADSSVALEGLGADLAAKRINYRIFSSKVPIRESKWTKQ